MPLCGSCKFGTVRRKKWTTKGKKSGSIFRDTENKTGAEVSVYQLQSDQPLLVPQFSVELTSAQIWSIQLIVNHFSDLNYVQLMRSTIQEENLSVKAAFKTWAAIFGVKIHRYHTDNDIFSEQPFRSETLEYRKLLLHANKYCTEAITKMLWTYSLKVFA